MPGYRRKKTEAEMEKVNALLSAARAQAETVERHGRPFTLLRLADEYGDRGPVGGLEDAADVDRPLDEV